MFCSFECVFFIPDVSPSLSSLPVIDRSSHNRKCQESGDLPHKPKTRTEIQYLPGRERAIITSSPSLLTVYEQRMGTIAIVIRRENEYIAPPHNLDRMVSIYSGVYFNTGKSEK